MGDLLDRRKYVNFNTLAQVRTKFMNKFDEYGITLHITLGNHDVFFKNSNEINSIKELFSYGYSNIKIYENPTDIVFDDMRDTRLKLHCNFYNMYNSKSWKITPNNGMLIFFPSEVHHQILKNNSNIERYSLAFNLMPTGKIGIENSDSFVNLKILR